MAKPDLMGATFAERAAATAGKASFDDPTPPAPEVEGNSTFGSRAKAAKKTSSKAVDSDSADAENKAVSKRAAAKKS